MRIIGFYFVAVLLLSLISFARYAHDKRRANGGGRRVRERTLHIVAFCGGWPGALVAQRRLRHKTLKSPFLILFWFLAVSHVAVAASAAYALFVRFPQD